MHRAWNSFVNAGRKRPLMPSRRPVPYLDEGFLRFPELKIVGGHIGFPWTDEMIGLLHENVYIDTLCLFTVLLPKTAFGIYETSGRSKVLFGNKLNWI